MVLAMPFVIIGIGTGASTGAGDGGVGDDGIDVGGIDGTSASGLEVS